MGWWRARSVRARLTLWYTTVLGAVLLLYAGGTFAFLSHRLFTELDGRLDDDVELAEEMIEPMDQGRFRWRGPAHHEEDVEEENRWIEVWSPKSTLLYSKPQPLDLPAPQVERASGKPPAPTSVATSSGGRVRVRSARYSIGGIPVVIRVARSEARLRHKLNEFLVVMALGLPVAVGFAGIGGYFLARTALAPVGRMADRAGAITADRLGERLPVENPGDELGRLATIINETFARLQRSFEGLRRFTSDAAHELRAPLTAIRSVGEVGLREHHEEAAYREAIGSMLEETDRLTHLVDALLTLSRADRGQAALSIQRLPLSDLVREAASDLGVLAEEKQQQVLLEIDGPVEVQADRLIIRRTIMNILDNAIRYTPPGGQIRIRLFARPREVVVEIADSGPGIAPEHHALIFERFYRVDKARSRNTGGVGLGLSIAHWAVEVHGGRIEVEGNEGQGSTFRVLLPIERDPKPKGPIS